MKEMIVFGGNSNPDLLTRICTELDVVPGKVTVSKFPDLETKVEIEENVRGKDVFVIQSISPPANDNLMELLFMIDALKRASASRITAVIPYYGYARQDRKQRARVPISARVIADLLEVSGTDRVLTLDLHAFQIQGFFKIPVDHFPGYLAFKNGFEKYLPELVVVASDAGSIQRAVPFANKMKVQMAVTDKRRIDDRNIEVRTVIGDVKGKTALLTDDIISTGGTMARDAEALKKAGAVKIIACVTHGVFAPGAAETLDRSELDMIHVTDSVKSPFPLPKKICFSNSVAPLLSEGIIRIHENRSVGEMIDRG